MTRHNSNPHSRVQPSSLATESTSNKRPTHEKCADGVRPSLRGIPAEIRVLIFEELFRSITVHRCVGHDTEASATTNIESDPEPHFASQNTSILRACRSIYTEAEPLLASNILVSFLSTAAFLNTMFSLPIPVISTLRHVRVKLVRTASDQWWRERSPLFALVYALPSLSNLQLDTLTVECCGDTDQAVWALPLFSQVRNVDREYCDREKIQAFKMMLQIDGWEQLRYITPSTRFIRRKLDSLEAREANDSRCTEWSKHLQRLPETVASRVRMYIANEKSVTGVVEDPRKRTPFDVVPEKFDASPMGSWDQEEFLQETLIVATRGEVAGGRPKRMLDLIGQDSAWTPSALTLSALKSYEILLVKQDWKALGDMGLTVGLEKMLQINGLTPPT